MSTFEKLVTSKNRRSKISKQIKGDKKTHQLCLGIWSSKKSSEQMEACIDMRVFNNHPKPGDIKVFESLPQQYVGRMEEKEEGRLICVFCGKTGIWNRIANNFWKIDSGEEAHSGIGIPLKITRTNWRKMTVENNLR